MTGEAEGDDGEGGEVACDVEEEFGGEELERVGGVGVGVAGLEEDGWEGRGGVGRVLVGRSWTGRGWRGG